MRVVGIKILKNKLPEFVRIAASGETVLVTDRTAQRVDGRTRSRPQRPVIYLDTSVAIAALLAEERRPAREFWDRPMASSRLLTYELWTAIHARALTRTHGEAAHALTDALTLLELDDEVLSRAFEPFPVPLRTLDALHLASMEYLRQLGITVELASYDSRLIAAARGMGFEIVEL